MAAQLLTVSGTSGSVLVQYVDTLSQPHKIVLDINANTYLDDAAIADTTIYYTTLSGDAIVTSGGLTVVENAKVSYTFLWEAPKSAPPTNYSQSFDGIVLGSDVQSFAESNYPFDRSLNVLTNLNELGLDNARATAYKIVDGTSTDPVKFYAVITTIGLEIDEVRLRVTSVDNESAIYIFPTGTDTEVPSGYTAIPSCELGYTSVI